MEDDEEASSVLLSWWGVSRYLSSPKGGVVWSKVAVGLVVGVTCTYPHPDFWENLLSASCLTCLTKVVIKTNLICSHKWNSVWFGLVSVEVVDFNPDPTVTLWLRISYSKQFSQCELEFSTIIKDKCSVHSLLQWHSVLWSDTKIQTQLREDKRF